MNDKIELAKKENISRYLKLAQKEDHLADLKDKQGLHGSARFHRSIALKNRSIASHISHISHQAS